MSGIKKYNTNLESEYLVLSQLRKVVKLSEMRSNGKKYRDNWNQLK